MGVVLMGKWCVVGRIMRSVCGWVRVRVRVRDVFGVWWVCASPLCMYVCVYV